MNSKMENVLLEKTMADGRTLRVLRYVSPEDEVPERVARIEAEIGNGVVNVACNAAGTVTGHCFALASGGTEGRPE